MERRIIDNRLQRNMREKARRTQMRHLLTLLSSVLRHPSKLSVPNLVNEAMSRIKKTERRIDELKERKTQLELEGFDLVKPSIQISSSDSTLELNLITGTTKNFMTYEVILFLQQLGAEVISFSSSRTPDDRIIYTIKSQAMYPRIGIDTSNIVERLQELVFQSENATPSN